MHEEPPHRHACALVVERRERIRPARVLGDGHIDLALLGAAGVELDRGEIHIDEGDAGEQDDHHSHPHAVFDPGGRQHTFVALVGTFAPGAEPLLDNDRDEGQGERSARDEDVPDAVLDDPANEREVVLQVVGRVERHAGLNIMHSVLGMMGVARRCWLQAMSVGAVPHWRAAFGRVEGIASTAPPLGITLRLIRFAACARAAEPPTTQLAEHHDLQRIVQRSQVVALLVEAAHRCGPRDCRFAALTGGGMFPSSRHGGSHQGECLAPSSPSPLRRPRPAGAWMVSRVGEPRVACRRTTRRGSTNRKTTRSPQAWAVVLWQRPTKIRAASMAPTEGAIGIHCKCVYQRVYAACGLKKLAIKSRT